MEANDYAFVHGMARTRAALERWRRNPGPILGSWFLGALAIAVLLLVGSGPLADSAGVSPGVLLFTALPHGCSS